MGRNKDRIFVSVYFRQNISRTEEGRQLGYARFHWGIWVQSKDSHGSGHMLEAVEQDVYANVPGSGGWTFEYRSTDWSRSGGLIQRILIGKLPSGVGPDQVRELLQAIPLPRPGVVPVENCVSWTEQAMAQLQAKGWAENFAVRQFMDFALKTTADMVDNGIYPGEKGVQNYTSRPFEEKE